MGYKKPIGSFADVCRAAVARPDSWQLLVTPQAGNGTAFRLPLPADGDVVAAIVQKGVETGIHYRVKLDPVGPVGDEALKARSFLRKACPGKQVSILWVPGPGERAGMPAPASETASRDDAVAQAERDARRLQADAARVRAEIELARLEQQRRREQGAAPAGDGLGLVVQQLRDEIRDLRAQVAAREQGGGAGGMVERLATTFAPVAIQAWQQWQEGARRREAQLAALEAAVRSRGADVPALADLVPAAPGLELGTILPAVQQILAIARAIQAPAEGAAAAGGGTGTLGEIRGLIEALIPRTGSMTAPTAPQRRALRGPPQQQPRPVVAAPGPATAQEQEGKRRVLALVTVLEQELAISSDPTLVADQVEPLLAACPKEFRQQLMHDRAQNILSSLARWIPAEDYARVTSAVAGNAQHGIWLEEFLVALQNPPEDDDDGGSEDSDGEADDEEDSDGEGDEGDEGDEEPAPDFQEAAPA